MGGTAELDPADLGVIEAARALRGRTLTAVELTEACLRRIDERNGGAPTDDGSADAVNAWVRLYRDEALDEARACDARLRREGDGAPLLCGIPLGVKDLYGVAGRPLTASSRVLEGHVAERDAAVLARLRAQGMVVIGHTHTHEFAAGGTTDQVANPWDHRRVAGGSSGGSAAALAARMVPAALGTDTCGSLRIPSACCGTSTIKATHGRVSIEGVIPLAPSLDHAGPMARSVADAALLLSAMAGATDVTPLFPPAAPLPPLPLAAREGRSPLEGVVVATTSHAGTLPWDDAVAAGFDAARRACEALGARVVDLPAPWVFDDEDLSAVLLTETWSFHERFASRAHLYRPSIAELMEAAEGRRDALAYLAAQRRRAEGTAAWQAWFASHRVDALLEPTQAVLPPTRGAGYERGHAGGAGDPLIALTSTWNMTGMPVVTLPVSPHVSVSLVGPLGGEATVVPIGVDLQARALGIPTFRPGGAVGA